MNIIAGFRNLDVNINCVGKTGLKCVNKSGYILDTKPNWTNVQKQLITKISTA